MMVYCATSFKPKKKKKAKGVVAKKYTPAKKFVDIKTSPQFTYLGKARSTEHIKSVQTKEFNTSRQESKKYTGTYVTGIAVTHKSNLVPITSQEQAVDISRMRR